MVKRSLIVAGVCGVVIAVVTLAWSLVGHALSPAVTWETGIIVILLDMAAYAVLIGLYLMMFAAVAFALVVALKRVIPPVPLPMAKRLLLGLLIASLLFGVYRGVDQGLLRAEPEHVSLAAVFVSWFGYDYITGECRGGYDESMHWGRFWGTHYKPEKGYYCSADPEVINWQLDLLEYIGVEALFVSWWGWGDTDLDGEISQHLDTELVGHPDMHMNRGIKALMDEIVAGDRGIKVALIAEPFTLSQGGIHPDDLTENQKQMVLDWLWDNYYSVYPDQIYHWQGKRLLLTFDPMRFPEDSRYTIKHWTGLPRNELTKMWGWEWFFSPPQDVIEGMSDDGVAFVYPRFDERYMVDGGVPWINWEPRCVNPLLDIEFYKGQWQKLVDNRERVNMIVLYSWNVYGEQAQCEPSYGDPAPTEDKCVEYTKLYYEAFLQGEDMP